MAKKPRFWGHKATTYRVAVALAAFLLVIVVLRATVVNLPSAQPPKHTAVPRQAIEHKPVKTAFQGLSSTSEDQRGALQAQTALLSQPIIHSAAEFQPQQHLPEYPLHTCSCAIEPVRTDDFSELRRVTHESTDPLDTPVRINASPLNGVASIFEILSDVYVANLASRKDRRHYMCEVLRYLNISAVLWPAYPRRHIVVRAYTTQVRAAVYKPGSSYDALKAPQPSPEPDHLTLSPDQQKRKPKQTFSGPRLRSGQAACYLSHREIWHDIKQRRLLKPVLILEDDVDIEVDFVLTMRNALSRLPDDWAVLWVGSCFEEINDHEKKIGPR
jgi:hypothetical protein